MSTYPECTLERGSVTLVTAGAVDEQSDGAGEDDLVVGHADLVRGLGGQRAHQLVHAHQYGVNVHDGCRLLKLKRAPILFELQRGCSNIDFQTLLYKSYGILDLDIVLVCGGLEGI